MSNESSELPNTSRQKLWGTLHQTLNKAEEAARKSAKFGGQLAQNASQATQATVGKIQRKLGEDYYAIFDENPLVLDTMSRSSLLVENKDLLSTAFNIPWTTTLLWSTAAGSAIALQRPTANVLGKVLHYAPGHFKRYDEINKYMDSVAGVGHRLKFGHSIENLPQIIEKFGIEGVPAYFMHVVQDFTTVGGLPIVPHAWDVKDALQSANVSKKVATGLVSMSFSSTLGALAVITIVSELWKLGQAITKKIKTKKYLNTANNAFQNHDYNASISNYQRALEIERSPYVLMALGQVYTLRASNRLRAHQTFTDAVTLLSDQPDGTVPYNRSKLSVRGLAGIQALSTADVLADIHPEHWNDHVRDLVNATVFSFTSAAAKQAKQSDDLIPDTAVTPAQFSAAINYYLAAKSACYYPFADERQEKVLRNLQESARCLGLMAQYDEERLRTPATTLRQLWVMELLPPDEIETALASY
jgi:tetratricopeptide (TPR) repeat protein